MDHFYYSVFRIFPNHLLNALTKMIDNHKIEPEEIRIHLGQPIVIKVLGKEYCCEETQITEQDIFFILMNAANGAFHAANDNIQNGYFPLINGCRLGFCGAGNVSEQRIYNIRDVSSLCLRIAKQKFGYADSIIKSCYSAGFKNTIIIGQPGAGKTTLLRECIRQLSEEGYYIGAVDERGEISGMQNGKPSFSIGPRTDIMYGINKQQAAMMLLRTMSPDILAMDEITAARDMHAIIEAVGCGVGLLTTIHGKTISDLQKPAFRDILDSKVFDIAILIEIRDQQRIYRTERLNE